ncbi:hypothetical protein AB0J83_25885 [Actinoplanes sp. NPDC049596]|uniref:hypothetical protein n=1 Tax=unclassified Actinoplanes TaxID=2626549 RepID=UPI003426151E
MFERLREAAGAVALLAVPGILLGAWAAGGLTLPVTVAGLVGVSLLVATLVLAVAGRAWWAYGVVALLVVVTAVAFTQLPRTRIGSVPVLGLLAVTTVLAVLLNRPRRGRDWWGRLDDLLVGRYNIPRRRAAELVAQARAAAGDQPPLPSVARYARELAEAEPAHRTPWWRDSRVFMALAVAGIVISSVADGEWVLAAAGTAVLAWALWDVRAVFRR